MNVSFAPLSCFFFVHWLVRSFVRSLVKQIVALVALAFVTQIQSICICLNLAIQYKLSHTVIVIFFFSLAPNNLNNFSMFFSVSAHDLDGNYVFECSCRSPFCI